MKKTKISVATLAICCVIASAATYGFTKLILPKETTSSQAIPVPDCVSKMEQIRLNTFEYTKPLILTDVNSESSTLREIHQKVEEYVNEVKSQNLASEVSVYFRRMNDGSYFSLNSSVAYNPASMSKIIYLITYLKEAESNPGIFDKKLFFQRHFSEVNQQNIKDFQLPENASYTVRQLINYMIENSDNDATILLSQNMNEKIFYQLFTDLDISVPPRFGEYFITATDYSKLFRVLFNATYLRPEYSEFGLELLTKSTFGNGLRRGIDSSVVMAHKFGERIIGEKVQVHEFGLVFIKGDPYLIGVMTSGGSLSQLSDIIAEISRITYSEYLNLQRS